LPLLPAKLINIRGPERMPEQITLPRIMSPATLARVQEKIPRPATLTNIILTGNTGQSARENPWSGNTH
jgi:hypothetical protein